MKAAQKNFCEMMLCPDHETPFEEVAALAECLDENGRFPDVEYTDQHPNNWQPHIHFERMVRLLSNRQVLENDKLRSRAMRGMDFWLRADQRCIRDRITIRIVKAVHFFICILSFTAGPKWCANGWPAINSLI